jgi:trans-AT polyketide synthase/acyltransferase/oxidoreductase domain-containing protein
MKPDAVVFAGQGAQRAGMAADFHRRWPAARRTFEEASEAVGEDLARVCFEPDERLHRTEYTQPCVLTAEIAIYRVAVAEFGFAPALFGGHSLGEYAALVAAGVLSFVDAVVLVRARAELMAQAVPAGAGAMAALLLGDDDSTDVVRIVRASGAEVVNLNSPSQLVIGGSKESVERARAALAAELSSVNVVELRVSGPFHSSLMRPAESDFALRLAGIAPRLRADRAAAVLSNYTGRFHDQDTLLTNLVRQVAAPVRWIDNMRALVGRAGRIYEIGPRPVLARFFAALGETVPSLVTAADAERELAGYLAPGGPAAPGELIRSVPPASQPQDAAQRLGDPGFRHDHGVRLAYAAGGMWDGISSPELVARLGRAGLLGFLGSAGLDLDRVEADIQRVRSMLPGGAPWGVNVTRDPYDPRAAALLDLLLRLDVRSIEVSGFVEPSDDLVRYRLSGLRPGPDGPAVPARRLLAKVSRPDVAARFLDPPPDPVVRRLLDRGLISAAEAALSGTVPMADDVCAEAEPAGPLDGFSLLPAVLRARAESAGRTPGRRPRVGLAGGLGSPAAVAAAFTLGADFVLTGSVNLCTAEAGASDAVKDLLATAGPEDFTTAPGTGTVEEGGRVAVLRKGGFAAARSAELYQAYQRHRGGAETLDPALRGRLERHLGRSFDEVWAAIGADPGRWEPAVVRRAERDGHARLALLVRWYLVEGRRRAGAGAPADRLDSLIRGGPALGTFNCEVRGTTLADWRRRHVEDVANYLMGHAPAVGAALWDRSRPAPAAGPALELANGKGSSR